MFKFLKNAIKQRKIKSQIELIQSKAELLKYKAILSANVTRKKTTQMNGTLKELQSAENLKAEVAKTIPENSISSQILQILENPTVKQLITVGAVKLMGGESISAGDDELITLYRKMPKEIKEKLKDAAMSYIG